MTEPLAFAHTNPLQRALRRFVASGPGSAMFAPVLDHVDRYVYRATRGRQTLASLVSGLPVVMLTTTGARSGLARSVPVLGFPTDEGLAVIASNWGKRGHPSWYHNLRCNPEGEVQLGETTRRFQAAEAEGESRRRIWEQALRVYPGFSQYERRASNRRITVFILHFV